MIVALVVDATIVLVLLVPATAVGPSQAGDTSERHALR
jgi:hypothetical protein